MVQAEIDAAAELIDFFRFNAKHAIELQEQQPLDAEGSTNTMLYRGLEVGAARQLTHHIAVFFLATPHCHVILKLSHCDSSVTWW